MSLVDGLLAFGILAAAGWLLYRAIVKNKNGCAGCSGCSSQSCGHRQNLK